MAQYALVKDGVITNLYDSVPRFCGNEISGFDLLSDAEREECGFFKVQQPDLSAYDPSVHIIVSQTHKMTNGKPVFEFKYEDKYSAEELLNLKKERFWNDVRGNRDALLAASDWAMMPDVVASKGQEWYTAWSTYRQALRDIVRDETQFDTHDGVPTMDIFPSEPDL
jgi:2-succinyl-5-enolpyruvyl-6-hydroxy-3-cyclohexene-1-carboxylate synthase